ncbi:MAG TPA: PilZ domain-containing protein [Novosphingobium sp.]|nr:PilZ domain-containing protein [Novosphingobium sp.]
MGDNEHRQIARDSLFVLAEVRLDGVDGVQRVKVRNLSAGGMMAEGSLKPVRGQLVWVDVRNIGWVEGSVAWVQDTRFGIAFREEIDPKIARAPVGAGEGTPRFVRPVLASASEASMLRKI